MRYKEKEEDFRKRRESQESWLRSPEVSYWIKTWLKYKHLIENVPDVNLDLSDLPNTYDALKALEIIAAQYPGRTRSAQKQF